MEEDKVRELLEKYWEGETTLEEEAFLREFFSQEASLPPDLITEKELFDYFRNEERIQPRQKDFTGKLKANWKKDNSTKLVSLKQMIRYAAVLVPVLIATYFLLTPNRKNTGTGITDSYDDPKKAIEETEKFLMLLSRNMNDGLAKVNVFDMLSEVKLSEKVK